MTEPGVDPATILRIADMHAVYRMFDSDGRLLYIGSSGRLGRFAEHGEKSWFVLVTRIALEWHPTEDVARHAERLAIASEQPQFNKNGRPKRKAPFVFQVVPEQSSHLEVPSPELTDDAKSSLMVLLGAGVSMRKAAESLGVTLWAMRTWLEGLRQEGLAEVVGEGRGARWRLTGAVSGDLP